ncbi:MAG: glucosyl-3-phosphoglycerate synthase, partial [Marmoricola sp.]
PARGKGEAMYKSLFVTTGDLLVFMDADLLDWDTHFVPGLLGPLLTRPEVGLVKGFYERPMLDGADAGAFEGGRVTELVARPLLNLYFAHLAGVVQPLAGEWAVRRDVLARLSVPTGYAVDVMALIDTAERLGVEAVAQVDLGRRAHRHQALRDLGAMATQISHALMTRAGVPATEHDGVVELRQYHRTEGRIAPVLREVPVTLRPPALEVGAVRA